MVNHPNRPTRRQRRMRKLWKELEPFGRIGHPTDAVRAEERRISAAISAIHAEILDEYVAAVTERYDAYVAALRPHIHIAKVAYNSAQKLWHDEQVADERTFSESQRDAAAEPGSRSGHERWMAAQKEIASAYGAAMRPLREAYLIATAPARAAMVSELEACHFRLDYEHMAMSVERRKLVVPQLPWLFGPAI